MKLSKEKKQKIIYIIFLQIILRRPHYANGIEGEKSRKRRIAC